MNKLDEIALRVGMDLFGCERPADVKYARALLADPELLEELSKDAEPVAYVHTFQAGGSALSWFGESSDSAGRKDWLLCEPLFTHPANTAEIEQRVAEACSRAIRLDESGRDGAGYFADILLDERWREYL